MSLRDVVFRMLVLTICCVLFDSVRITATAAVDGFLQTALLGVSFSNTTYRVIMINDLNDFIIALQISYKPYYSYVSWFY